MYISKKTNAAIGALILIITHEQVLDTEYQAPTLSELQEVRFDQIDVNKMMDDLRSISQRFTVELIEQAFNQPLDLNETDTGQFQLIETILSSPETESARATKLITVFREGLISTNTAAEQKMLRNIARLIYREDRSVAQHYLFAKELQSFG